MQSRVRPAARSNRRRALAEPQAGERVGAGFGVGEDLLEVARDAAAMPIQLGQQGRPVGKAHAGGDDGAGVVGRRQQVVCASSTYCSRCSRRRRKS